MLLGFGGFFTLVVCAVKCSKSSVMKIETRDNLTLGHTKIKLEICNTLTCLTANSHPCEMSQLFQSIISELLYPFHETKVGEMYKMCLKPSNN